MTQKSVQKIIKNANWSIRVHFLYIISTSFGVKKWSEGIFVWVRYVVAESVRDIAGNNEIFAAIWGDSGLGGRVIKVRIIVG